MRRHATLEFLEACRGAQTPGEIAALLFAATARFGIAYVACASHADPLKPPPGAVAMVNYPEAWLTRFSERNYALRDPVFFGARNFPLPFNWDELVRRMKLAPDQKRILNEAAELGLRDGMTIPIHAPGILPASCSLVPGPDGVDPLITPDLFLIAVHAHEEARLRGACLRRAPVMLTKRQQECLALAGAAKSDWTIGELLGISPRTVHNTIEHAKKRYGVSHRIQAVTRALIDGQIQIDELSR